MGAARGVGEPPGGEDRRCPGASGLSTSNGSIPYPARGHRVTRPSVSLLEVASASLTALSAARQAHFARLGEAPERYVELLLRQGAAHHLRWRGRDVGYALVGEDRGLRPTAGCAAENLASRRALTRAGFASQHRLLLFSPPSVPEDHRPRAPTEGGSAP